MDGEEPVLVVGAGPTGLTAAVELARREVPVRIVDLEPEPVQESRALVAQPRTLEIWLDQGIAVTAFEQGIQLEAFQIRIEGSSPTRVAVEGMGGPFDQPLTIPQDVTEALLVERLDELGVEVDRPVELERLENGDGAPKAHLSTPDGTETVEPDWLIAADGAHSTVRHELDLPFEGVPYPDRFAIADADLDTPLEPGEIHAWIEGGRLLLVVPLRRPGHHRVITTHRPEDPGDPDTPPTHDEIQALVDRVADVPIDVHEPRWRSVFRVHCRGVPRYRVGRVLLAGDAAHIHSPAGGQGMNTGIQDAHNLAWKIAHVHRGQASPDLLESYHDERHPVGQRLLDTTDRLFQLAGSDATWARLFRSTIGANVLRLPATQRWLRRFVSQRGIRYRDSPAVGPDRERSPLPFVGDEGPRPGDQAPDGEVVTADGREVRLLEALAGRRRHRLLVFAGKRSDVGPEDLDAAMDPILAAGGDLVETAWLVVDQPPEGGVRERLTLLGDPDGELHEAYGRQSPGYEVVRPDGHIGARADGLAPGPLEAYLDRLSSLREP